MLLRGAACWRCVELALEACSSQLAAAGMLRWVVACMGAPGSSLQCMSDLWGGAGGGPP